MPRSSSILTGWLIDLWRLLNPAGGVVEPEVRILDDWRTEFAWRGAPLTFDRRTKLVLRGGRTLASLADIKSVDIQHIVGNDDRREHWTISLGTRTFSSVRIGTTRDDVEASIAAARLSTVAGVKVRAL